MARAEDNDALWGSGCLLDTESPHPPYCRSRVGPWSRSQLLEDDVRAFGVLVQCRGYAGPNGLLGARRIRFMDCVDDRVQIATVLVYILQDTY